jgi:DNA-binding response OmpR family regulator
MEQIMSKKILVIEDSHLMCHILEQELQQKGFEVVTAYDGKGGLLKAREIIFDAIILDLVLPDIPGEEVCRELKKFPETEKIPIIMLTGKDSDADRVVGRVLGADSYVAKPFDIGRLMDEISKYIGLTIFAVCVFMNCLAQGAEDNQTLQVPPGMELIKVGEHNVYVAQGTKVTQKGSQLVLEPPDEFIARKILALEQEIAQLKARVEDMRIQIEALKKAREADNGSK